MDSVFRTFFNIFFEKCAFYFMACHSVGTSGHSGSYFQRLVFCQPLVDLDNTQRVQLKLGAQYRCLKMYILFVVSQITFDLTIPGVEIVVLASYSVERCTIW